MPETSILKSTRKVLGLGADVDEFDEDVIMHVNSAFATLNQLGIGPADGFAIEDDSSAWVDFLADDPRLNSVKTYIFLKVRLVFDPPATSFHLGAINDQIREIEWRLSVKREGESWTEPIPTSTTEPDVIVVPSSQAWYSEP